jgi:hypothetical protein
MLAVAVGEIPNLNFGSKKIAFTAKGDILAIATSN